MGDVNGSKKFQDHVATAHSKGALLLYLRDS
jgi:hypothetical protein